MKYFSYILVFVLSFDLTIANKLKHETNLVAIKALKEELNNQGVLKTTCFRKILNITENVENGLLWATWVWDSMQSPHGQFFGSRYHLGNFDECLSTPWSQSYPELRTQYCLADVTLYQQPRSIKLEPFMSAKSQLKGITRNGLKFNTMTMGVCVPVECNAEEIQVFVKGYLKSTLVGSLPPNSSIAINDCQNAEKNPVTVRFYIVLVICLIFTLFVLVSTVYLYSKTKFNIESPAYILANCFCVRRNTQSLLSTNKNDIQVLHGIRFLSACMIIVFHMWYMMTSLGYSNFIEYDAMYEKLLFYVYHTEIAVDTFFMMSGLLIMKSLLSSRPGLVNAMKIFIKRYIRFMFSFFFIVLILSAFAKHFITGPLVPRLINSDTEICSKNIWLNVLTLSNYMDTSNMCYPTSWYISSDLHMCIVAIFIFLIYRRIPRFGLILFSVTAITSLVLPGLTTYQMHLFPKPRYDIESLQMYRQVILTTPTYIWSHLRAAPFFVGVIFGYIMTKYNPKQYRNTISKTSSQGILAAAFTTFLLIIYIGGYLQHRDFSILSAAVFSSLHRPLWAVAVGSLVCVCEYGSVPPITMFLSWSAFDPLSKLCYGIYIIHPAVIIRIIATTRNQIQYDSYNMILEYCGVLLESCFFSYIQWLFFEAPSSNVVGFLLAEKKKRNCEVGVPTE